MKIWYISTKENWMRTFFSELPEWSNLFLLWQKFGYVDVEEIDGKVGTITFKLIHIFDPETINTLINWLSIAFKSYTLNFKNSPCIIVTMKANEELKYPVIPKGLIDEVTKTVQTKEQHAAFISSLGFSI